MQKNRLINLLIQKDFMTMVSGCWEHKHLVWDELNTAKSNNTRIAAVWLGIANVFAFITHQLMFFSLKQCGINPT